MQEPCTWAPGSVEKRHISIRRLGQINQTSYSQRSKPDKSHLTEVKVTHQLHQKLALLLLHMENATEISSGTGAPELVRTPWSVREHL